VIVNPVSQPAASAEAEPVDIARMAGWHLFGEVGAAPEPVSPPAAAEPVQGSAALEGIEKGARETRLDLRLVGVVASTDDGLGFAIIEYKREQEVYAVEDRLPVPGQVVLAKVMSRQVVLDNGGTYELLTLFEESELDAQLGAQTPAAGPEARRAPETEVKKIDRRTDADTTALAQRYRDQLYRDPQSLAEVVIVSAVREEGELRGYRIGPGRNREQFERLGFEPGDLVTSVNGIALNDPANAMRLYQAMRSATEAVFELERKEQQLQVSLSLADIGVQP
jgi:general secretion pathway protein C